jgi:hypothetical protein
MAYYPMPSCFNDSQSKVVSYLNNFTLTKFVNLPGQKQFRALQGRFLRVIVQIQLAFGRSYEGH